MFTSSGLIYFAGLFQAVMIAAAGYLAQPGDPTGRPLAIALGGVVVSAVVTFIAAHQVKAAMSRQIDEAIETVKPHP